MSEAFSHYHGVDWLASIFAVLMIYSLGGRKRIGFWFGICANLSWMAFAVFSESLPIFLSNIVFLALNVRGLVKWRPAPATGAAS